jgi:hypothetical protein
MGRFANGQPICSVISAVSSGLHRSGVAELLVKLTRSPEERPNKLRISLTAAVSPADGWQKRATSSAYREMGGINFWGYNLCMIPNPAARLKSLLRISMEITNSWGDRGSP